MRCLHLQAGAVLLLTSVPTGSDELAFGVERGARIEKKFESRTELEMIDRELVLNGEDFDDGADEFELRMTWTSELAFLDEYREVGKARPLTLAREFLALGSREQTHVEGDGFDHDEEIERESKLEGKTVLFSWKESEEDYSVRFDGEERGDAALLEGQVGDCDLLAFLPPEGISEGESWKLDARLLRRLTDPGGKLHLSSDDDDDDDEERESQLKDNEKGDLVATFEGIREEEGVRVAVIALRAEITTHATLNDEDEDGDPVEERYEVSVDGEGEILWDLAQGRPHSYRLENELEVTFTETTTWEDDDDGETMVFVMRLVMSGTSRVSGTWRDAD